MLKKILIAASLAAAFVVSAQVAEAKVKVFIGIGDNPGGYCAHHYDPIHCGGGGYGGGYYGGDGYYGGGYGYYPQPYYAPAYPIMRNNISCNDAKWMLSDRGYRKINAQDCRGSSYTFTARRNGGKFLINVNSRNGRIQSVRPIY